MEMADSVKEGAAKRKEKAAKLVSDAEVVQIGQEGGLSNKRVDKVKDKEKKRKAKLFDLTDLISDDCDNITGKKKDG